MFGNSIWWSTLTLILHHDDKVENTLAIGSLMKKEATIDLPEMKSKKSIDSINAKNENI